MSPSKWDHLPIVDVARALGIAVKGTKAECFAGHDRQTPSLSFNTRQNYWKCFGCGLKGRVFGLVMAVLQSGADDARRWCDREFGDRILGQRISRQPAMTEKIVRIAEFVSAADWEVNASLLSRSPLGTNGSAYLTGRGFTSRTVEQFRVGEISNPKGILEFLTSRWGLQRLVQAGLVMDTIRSNRRPSYRLVWWDSTILFPFIEKEKVVYLQGRRLAAGGPKYLGLKGIAKPIYNSGILETLKAGSTVYLCEGVPDTMAATQAGRNAIGVLGATSFRTEWVSRLLPFHILVVPDLIWGESSLKLSCSRRSCDAGGW